MKLHAVLNGLAVLIAVVAIAIAGVYLFSDKPSRTSVKDTQTATSTASGMQFEIADTEAKMELGLGNRTSIPDNYGMLFAFERDGRYGFWMKDMLVPIDIIWLSDNGDIVLIDHSVDPSTYPHPFFPPEPVKYVLETKAGFAVAHGWDVGTHVPLPAPYGK